MMRRSAILALSIALAGVGSTAAGDVAFPGHVDTLFSGRGGVAFEVTGADLVEPNVAAVAVTTRDATLFLAFELTDSLVARLPLRVAVRPSEFGYFIGRNPGETDLIALKPDQAAAHLMAPIVEPLCESVSLMASAPLHLVDDGVAVNVRYGLGAAQRSSTRVAEPGKIGIWSFRCGLSVANCPIGKTCGLLGGGECDIGEDVFGGEWCACF